MNKKLISKYNQTDSLIIITSYPPKGTRYGDRVGGVASFAKNTLLGMTRYSQRKIIVLAEILNIPDVYEEEGILVVRCWKRNFPKLYIDILQMLILFSKVKQIKVQFEFALYGDFVVTGFLPFFLNLLKLLGKQITAVIHQVVLDLSSLSGHLGWKEKSLKSEIYSMLMKIYFFLLCAVSRKVVVLEEEFKKRLIALGIRQDKIIVIHHGVDLELKGISKIAAKKVLGIKKDEFTILLFGFLTWYKGSDLAVKAVTKLLHDHPQMRIRLILAGGESITQNQKKHYQQYVQKLYKLVQNQPQITITGFVPENLISTYYSCADLVLLPYRSFMSSSGVLSLALSFGKPCLISDILADWFDGADIAKDLKKQILVKPQISTIAKAINIVYKNQHILEQLTIASCKMAQKRDYQRSGYTYHQLFIEEKINFIKSNQAQLAMEYQKEV